MKLLTCTSICTLAATAWSFPASQIATQPELLERSILSKRGNGDAPNVPGEDFSLDQLIDVTGDHAFVPPGPNDYRGPCPGLNALANHNYLPHDGVATIEQFVDATGKAVGLGHDAALALATLGAVGSGDGVSWSIGGKSNNGNGISNSHNHYEVDASMTRPDLYQIGNDFATQPDQFQALIDLQSDPDTANYNLPVIYDFRSRRYDQQVAANPEFFYGPLNQLVSHGAYSFAYRLMANHSEEDPVGFMNQEGLKSWWAISGDSGSYTAQQGWERIPENWYRRSLSVPYSIAYLSADLVYPLTKYPKFGSVGGNTGSVNSFTGLDIGNLTGGVYSAQSLASGDGTNAQCFFYQVLRQAPLPLGASAILPGALGGVLSPLVQLTTEAMNALGCNQLVEIDEAQLQGYPGSKHPSQ